MSVKGTWSRIKNQAAVDATFARMAETKRRKAADRLLQEQAAEEVKEFQLRKARTADNNARQ